MTYGTETNHTAEGCSLQLDLSSCFSLKTACSAVASLRTSAPHLFPLAAGALCTLQETYLSSQQNSIQSSAFAHWVAPSQAALDNFLSLYENERIKGLNDQTDIKLRYGSPPLQQASQTVSSYSGTSSVLPKIHDPLLDPAKAF